MPDTDERINPTEPKEAGRCMGKGEFYGWWFECTSCEVTSLRRYFSFCPACGERVDMPENPAKPEHEGVGRWTAPHDGTSLREHYRAKQESRQ